MPFFLVLFPVLFLLMFIGSGIDFYRNNRPYREQLAAQRRQRRKTLAMRGFRSRPFT